MNMSASARQSVSARLSFLSKGEPRVSLQPGARQVTMSAAVANMMLRRHQIFPLPERSLDPAPTEACVLADRSFGSGQTARHRKRETSEWGGFEAAGLLDPETMDPVIPVHSSPQRSPRDCRKSGKQFGGSIASNYESLPAKVASSNGGISLDGQSIDSDAVARDNCGGPALVFNSAAPEMTAANIETQVASLQDQPKHDIAIMVAVLNIFWLFGSGEDDPEAMAARHVLAQEARFVSLPNCQKVACGDCQSPGASRLKVLRCNIPVLAVENVTV
jgi:hypothetical protein